MKKLFAIALGLMLALSLSLGALAEGAGPTVEAIQKKGKLVMLTEATFAPFEYLKGNQVVGLDVDLCQMVADKLGVQLEVVDMNFDLLIEALKSGKGDIVAAGMTLTPERAEQVDFSTVYLNSSLLVIVAADSPIQAIKDLEGKKVSAQESTTGDIWASENIPGVKMQQYKSAVEAANAVASGKADACVMDILPAQSLVKGSGGKLMLLEEMAAQEETAMAVAKGKEDLLAVVDEVLKEAMENGSLEASLELHKQQGAGD